MRDLLTIIEAVETKKLTTEKLPYSKSELNPVMSDATINYHYEKLAKGYAERYNKGEGDADSFRNYRLLRQVTNLQMQV
jgi:superoxide dismutase